MFVLAVAGPSIVLGYVRPIVPYFQNSFRNSRNKEDILYIDCIDLLLGNMDDNVRGVGGYVVSDPNSGGEA
jgi:hypothetical protein